MSYPPPYNENPDIINLELLERDLFLGFADHGYKLDRVSDPFMMTQNVLTTQFLNPLTTPYSQNREQRSPASSDNDSSKSTSDTRSTTSSGTDEDKERSSGESKPKRKLLSKDEKMEKRKQQTRAASKTYRQRKKMLEGELNERLENVNFEKMRLAEIAKANEDKLKQLQRENELLRQSQVAQAQSLTTRTHSVLSLLEKQLLEGAPSHVLLHTIQSMKSVYGDHNNVSHSHLQQLVTPQTMQHLTHANFFDNAWNCVEIRARTNGIVDLVTKIKAEVTDITNEQIEDLDDLIEEHYDVLEQLRRQRFEMVVFMKDYLNDPNNKTEEQAKEFAVTLYCFRENFYEESQQWAYTVSEILENILTPQQSAKFLLKHQVITAGIRQVSSIWSVLEPSWDPIAKSV